jgi:hypothetical protein
VASPEFDAMSAIVSAIKLEIAGALAIGHCHHFVRFHRFCNYARKARR